MNLVREISNRTISISDFNRGLAGRIFDDVKVNGTKIVLKNNTPECVLLSPEEYSKLIEDAEDARDLLLANERLSNNYKDKLISQEEFEKTFKINFDEMTPLDEDEFE